VSYVFQFGDVWNSWDELMLGAWLTVRLSLSAMVLGLVVAIVCALAKTSGPKLLGALVDAYVELIRNTPFLIQLFIVFFGLPVLGLRLEADWAALLAMVVNVGAYAAEIVRAGIESISRGQIEAARALGLRPLQTFRHIILLPAIRTVYPALTSQFILLMLNSSVCSTIAADELTAAANDIQSRTFRSFEVYFVATGIYLVLSFGFPPSSPASSEPSSRGTGSAEPTMRSLGPNELLFILLATRWTLALSAIAFLGGGVGGLIVALARTGGLSWLRVASAGYIRLFQGTPLLMQLFLVFFGINILGLSVDPWTAASLGLTLNASAFLGEIWRGCIEAIPRGQW